MVSKLFLTVCVWDLVDFPLRPLTYLSAPSNKDSFKAWHQSHESKGVSQMPLALSSEKFSAFGGMGVKQGLRKRSLSSWSDESSNRLTNRCDILNLRILMKTFRDIDHILPQVAPKCLCITELLASVVCSEGLHNCIHFIYGKAEARATQSESLAEVRAKSVSLPGFFGCAGSSLRHMGFPSCHVWASLVPVHGILHLWRAGFSGYGLQC